MPERKPTISHERIKGSRYTEEEIQTGLTLMAYCGGNSRRAAREWQKQTGQHIEHSILRDWATRLHVERYQRIQAAVSDHLADLSESVALKANTLAAETLDRVEDNMDQIPPRDLSTTFRNLQVGAGVATDKSLLLRGRPTQITESRDASSLVRKLIKQGVIEGTAEELEPQ